MHDHNGMLSIPQLLRLHARQRGGRTAFADDQRVVTWAELERRTARFARARGRAWRPGGVLPGQRRGPGRRTPRHGPGRRGRGAAEPALHRRRARDAAGRLRPGAAGHRPAASAAGRARDSRAASASGGDRRGAVAGQRSRLADLAPVRPRGRATTSGWTSRPGCSTRPAPPALPGPPCPASGPRCGRRSPVYGPLLGLSCGRSPAVAAAAGAQLCPLALRAWHDRGRGQRADHRQRRTRPGWRG